MSIVSPDPDDKTQPPRKKQVGKRLRYEIFRRDNFTCRYCRSTDGEITIDHVIPEALGGTDDPGNLVTACRDCNLGKGAGHPGEPVVDDVAQDALRWSRAMRQVAEMFVSEREKSLQIYAALWDEWNELNFTHRQGRLNLPGNWRDSVDHWIKLGVPIELIQDAFGIAARNKLIDSYSVWRYACGVVWRRIGEMQDAARGLLASEEQ